MKIVIVSDSHSNYDVLNEILMKNYDADYFFHLGDSELPKYLLTKFCAIRGNCDYNDLPLEKDVEIEGFKIHMEHGNSFNFMIDTTNYIKSKKCDIFLYGHTHVKYAKKIGKTFVFNPGSITRPRNSEIGTYLLLYLTKDLPIEYEFKTLENEK